MMDVSNKLFALSFSLLIVASFGSNLSYESAAGEKAKADVAVVEMRSFSPIQTTGKKKVTSSTAVFVSDVMLMTVAHTLCDDCLYEVRQKGVVKRMLLVKKHVKADLTLFRLADGEAPSPLWYTLCDDEIYLEPGHRVITVIGYPLWFGTVPWYSKAIIAHDTQHEFIYDGFAATGMSGGAIICEHGCLAGIIRALIGGGDTVGSAGVVIKSSVLLELYPGE